ncbi:MAG: S-layer homology domain-containing protein [Oscillospiraceae bacterium]|nr:S-layer homology domain-containing protein [Oscillospiraceae bacterium]
MKKNFKILCVIIAAMILANMGMTSVFAAESMTITAATVTGEAGGVVDVPVYLSENTGIAGFSFEISFDKTKLEYVSCTDPHDVFPVTVAFIPTNKDIANERGRITVTASNQGIGELEDSDADGILAVLRFNIADNVTGTIPLNITNALTVSADDITLPISVEKENGAVIIEGEPDEPDEPDEPEPPVLTYSVFFNPFSVNFTPATVGYAVPAGRTVTITSSGTGATGDLAIALSGTNANAFVLSDASLPSIPAAGGSSSFTISPISGLGAGTYAAAVTVTSPNGISAAISVTFAVQAAPPPPGDTGGGGGGGGGNTGGGTNIPSGGGDSGLPGPGGDTGNTTTQTGEDEEEGAEDEYVPFTVVEFKTHEMYIMGYGDGTIRPDANLSREEAAQILYNILGKPASSADFKLTVGDVGENRWSYPAIQYLVEQNILRGYPDDTFKPANTMTRAEFCTMLCGYLELELPENQPDEQNFTDVEGHWAWQYILAMSEKGYIAGYPDGTFRPDRHITRAEAITLLNRIQNRKPDAEAIAKLPQMYTDLPATHWAYDQMIEATLTHDYTYDEENGVENWDWTGDGNPAD